MSLRRIAQVGLWSAGLILTVAWLKFSRNPANFPEVNPLNVSAPLSSEMVIGTLLLVFVEQLLAYLITAGLFYRRYWVRGTSDSARLQGEAPAPGQTRHEITWSVVSLGIFSFNVVAALVAWRLGAFPKFRVVPGELGWGEAAVSLGALVLVQEVCFYTFHRVLHTRAFMRFHKVHHRSQVPTPFSMNSFHPVEAVFHMVYVPIAMALVPMSPMIVFVGTIVVSGLNNVYGHLNFEPGVMLRWKRFRGLIVGNAAIHALHHRHANGNFGLYSEVLDRLFGTVQPGTDAFVKGVQVRERKDRAAAQ